MTRIAYLTDLHFGYSQNKTRMDSFGNKMARLPANTRAVCITGDIFTLAGAAIWDPMFKSSLKPAEVEERHKISQELANEWAPQFLGAIPKGIAVFMIPGNADVLAYEYLAALGNMGQNMHFIDGKALKEGSSFNLLGAGRIIPDNGAAENCLKHNPWYGGVISADALDQTLNGLLALTNGWQPEDWSNAVLLTHMPALGHVDQFKGTSQGNSNILDFIRVTRPLLHLAGHVHEGPFVNDKYLPWSIIDGQTVSLNAGGGPRHDSENGVRVLSIDVKALMLAREAGRLKEAAAGAIISI